MINLNDFPVSLFFISFAFFVAGLFAWFFAIIKSEQNRLMTMAELQTEVDFIFSYESGYPMTENFQAEKESSLKNRALELRKEYEKQINLLSNEINEIDHVLDEIEFNNQPLHFLDGGLVNSNGKYIEASHV